MKKVSISTNDISLLAMFTVIVIILQLIGAFIRFGVFSISLVLIPIVIIAAIIGPYGGAWLGLVFGLTVLFSGDAAVFLAVDFPATILVVLLKGLLAGFFTGLTYKLLLRKGQTLAAITSAIVCPLINTSIFLIGVRLFFFSTIIAWSESAVFSSVLNYMIFGLVGLNFLLEMGVNLFLSPICIRLIDYSKQNRANKL